MAGHTKDPQVKKSTIEALDAELGDLPTDSAIVCVTGDHATPTYPDVIHSGDPVPFIVDGPGVRADEVERFGELDCAARDPRPPARAGHDARAPERRRPPALPRLAPDAVLRRRRLSRPPRAALDGDRSPHPQLRDLARALRPGRVDERVPPLADRRHGRRCPAHRLGSRLQPLAGLRAWGAAAREERPRVRRVREPARRRRRDHGHAR